MTAKSIKRSGTLLIITGILIGVPMLFHPDETKAGAMLFATWVPVHVLMGIGSVIGLAGLAGLYSALRTRITAFGTAAFGLAILGTVLLTGLFFFVEATLLPALSRDPVYQPLLSDSGPLMAGAFGFAVWGSFTILSIGYLLLAIYLVTSGTITAANGLLFIGAPLAAFAPPLPHVLGIIGGVLLGAAFIWLGISVRSGIAHKILEEEQQLQDECFAH